MNTQDFIIQVEGPWVVLLQASEEIWLNREQATELMRRLEQILAFPVGLEVDHE